MISLQVVIPAQAGIQEARGTLKKLDSRFPITTFGDKLHGNDKKGKAKTFYETLILKSVLGQSLRILLYSERIYQK